MILRPFYAEFRRQSSQGAGLVVIARVIVHIVERDEVCTCLEIDNADVFVHIPCGLGSRMDPLVDKGA